MSGSGISKVGIVGAGQLGRMLALAGYPLGIRCRFLDQSPDAPAAQVAPIMLGDLKDAGGIAELAKGSEVLTFDWENVPAAALKGVNRRTPIRPSAESLSISQDRLQEKALFQELRIPVTPHEAVDSLEDLERAARRLGLPGVLKTRRLGYDGKGQHLIRTKRDLGAAWESLRGAPLIYEKFMRFSCEVSLIAARSPAGETVFYPLARNTHRGGILRVSIAPHVDAALERAARRHLQRLLEALDYAGILTVEFFVVDGRLVANEMAPRVHNSGHWTIEGCQTSQFENHLRAICGLPLGSTRPLGHAAMINFIGKMPSRERLLRIEGLAFHDYGKEPRAARKLGHCTVLQDSAAARDRSLALALKHVRWT